MHPSPLVLAALVALAALADVAAAAPPTDLARAKAVLEQQRQAILTRDVTKLEATLGDDALLILPGARNVHVGKDGVGPMFYEDFGDPDLPGFFVDSAVWRDVKVVTAGDMVGVSATLALVYDSGGPPGPPRLDRVTELLVRDGSSGDLTVLAAHISEPMPAKDALASLGKPEFAWLPIPDATPDRTAAHLTSPARLAANLVDDPGVIVVGTEAGERAVGAARARKLLTSWKDLKLTVEGGVRVGAAGAGGGGYLAANLRLAVGKQSLPMRVLVLTAEDPQSDHPHILAVHFSSPSAMWR